MDGSLQQLGDVREHVGEMAGQVRALQERAGRIGRITMVVKDLADQSSMVALNAAIEATRAGEHGRTFAVVAQQIRQLSDQSTTATEQVHGVLLDVEVGIQEAVRLSNAGMERAALRPFPLARVHGENLRKLTSVVEENAASARTFLRAVDQQAAGIAQIFQAITQLGSTMDRTVEAMQATVAITTRAQQAADEVADAMAGYRWRPGEGAGRQPLQAEGAHPRLQGVHRDAQARGGAGLVPAELAQRPADVLRGEVARVLVAGHGAAAAVRGRGHVPGPGAPACPRPTACSPGTRAGRPR